MSADELSLSEAHGTGTALGDPIESGSLASVVLSARGAWSAPLPVGGIKANIGHAEPAAGMTGLLKLVSALEQGGAAPNAQLRVLNPHVGRALGEEVRGALPTQRASLPGSDEVVRHGGVSSFGYSGTIGHCLQRTDDRPSFGPGDAIFELSLIHI